MRGDGSKNVAIMKFLKYKKVSKARSISLSYPGSSKIRSTSSSPPLISLFYKQLNLFLDPPRDGKRCLGYIYLPRFAASAPPDVDGAPAAERPSLFQLQTCMIQCHSSSPHFQSHINNRYSSFRQIVTRHSHYHKVSSCLISTLKSPAVSIKPWADPTERFDKRQ